MEEELNSMQHNIVWELGDLPKGSKPINGYSKPRKILKGRMINTRFVGKGFFLESSWL